MFKGRIRVDELRKALAICLAINNDHKIIISKECWKTARSDTSNACMASVVLNRSLFETYHLDEDELSIGLDLKKIFPIFPTGKTKAFVDIKFEDNKIELVFEKYKYSLRAISINYVGGDTVKLNNAIEKIITGNTCKFKMDIKTLKESLNMIKKINETPAMCVIFENKNHTLKLLYSENAGDSLELTQTTECEGDDAVATYGGDYLIPLVKELSEYDSFMNCSFGNGRPIYWELHTDGLDIKIVIAPRIPPKND